MMLSLMVTLLPSIMLSGFIFPIASMPRALQFVSYALPATHFLVIVRGVMLKGNALADLWPHVAALGGIGFVLMILAVKRFSLKLGAKGEARERRLPSRAQGAAADLPGSDSCCESSFSCRSCSSSSSDTR